MKLFKGTLIPHKIKGLFSLSIEEIDTTWKQYLDTNKQHFLFRVNNDDLNIVNRDEFKCAETELHLRLTDLYGNKKFSLSDSEYKYTTMVGFRNLLNEIAMAITDRYMYVDNDITYNKLNELAIDYIYKEHDDKFITTLLIQLILRKLNSEEVAKIRAFINERCPKIKFKSLEDLYDNKLVMETFNLQEFKNDDHILLRCFPGIQFKKRSILDGFINKEGIFEIEDKPLNHLHLTVSRNETTSFHFRKKSNHWIGTIIESTSQHNQSLRILRNFDNSDGVLKFSQEEFLDFLEDISKDYGIICFSPRDFYIKNIKITIPKEISTATWVNTDIPSNMIVVEWEQISKLLGGPKKCRTKDILLKRIVELAAIEYEYFEPTLNEFFKKNKFIVIPTSHSSKRKNTIAELWKKEGSMNLPRGIIDRLMKIIYIYRHLRGNAIIDPDYINDSLSPEHILKMAIFKQTHEVPEYFYRMEVKNG